MNENNITRFEVSNFKKFDHLVVENIGQVNLITGDNNVGKTTLLEALLCIWKNSFWIKYLHQTLDSRQLNFHLEDIHAESPKFPAENFLSYIFNDLGKRLVCKLQLRSGAIEEFAMEHKKLEEVDEKTIENYRRDPYKVFNIQDWVFFYKDGKKDEIQWLYCDDMDKSMPQYLYMPFISFLHFSSDRMQQMVHNLDTDAKKFVVQSLKNLIPEIEDFDYGQVGNLNMPRIATARKKTYEPITTFGDGVQKVFRYLVEIIYASSRQVREDRIMIDEIDTGVHYSKMKDVWKALFWVSKQTGIQIFATTHSMDCIKAFVEAGEENEEMKSGLRLIELEEFKLKDGTNKQLATTFTHSQLDASLDSELNVRGGKLW